jgi:nucleoid DNA-binding protein
MINLFLTMETITKEKITELLKDRIGLSAVICEELINNIFTEIYEITKKENKFRIKNFGNFYVNNKESRPARNLHTGQTIILSARKVMRFLPARALKQEINKIQIL